MEDKETNYIIERINDDISFTPKNGYDSILIWLPGLGDTAQSYLEDFLDQRRPVPEKMKVIVLTSPKIPLSIKGGALTNSWFEYVDRSNFKIQQDSVKENVERIQNLIFKEADKVGISTSRVFLGGFSQGSCMSFLIGLTISELSLAGIICCSGYMFSHVIANSEKTRLPILICHGTQDKVVKLDKAKSSYQRLFDEGFNVEYKVYNFNHELTWEEYKDIKDFILRNLN
jgi:predicted esterase